MISMFGKVKALCALVVMGVESVAYSAAPTVTSVTAQQRYPWNGLVDIVVTFNGAESDVAKANCTFAATDSATKTALAIAHVNQQGNDTGSGTSWTRRFIWDTNADLGEVKIDDVELVADIEAEEEPIGSGGVQLWAGGPYWAECNVGASKPEEYGLYFWWGDKVGHTQAGSWFNPDSCPIYYKKIEELMSLGYINSSGILKPEHDAATAYLGSPWRMPTRDESMALKENCDTEWITRNGVLGALITGRGEFSSSSIFLPAAGYAHYSMSGVGSHCFYWTSSVDDKEFAYVLAGNTPHPVGGGNWVCFIYDGCPVRPVRGFAR